MRRSEGFTLVSAIFLLVVISAAGAFMVRIGGAQRQTAIFGLQGAKAYYAARSGIEWRVHRALTVPGSCPSGTTTTDSFTLAEGGVAGFRLTLSCESDLHTQAGVTSTRFHVIAFAERGVYGSRDYVSRRLETTVTDGA